MLVMLVFGIGFVGNGGLVCLRVRVLRLET